jgi:hypothetical protein
MRNWLRYAAGVIAAFATLTAIARTASASSDEPRVRTLDADATRKATTVRIDEAKAFSLWSGGRIVECLAPAHYAGATNAAQFGAVMRFAPEGNALAPAVVELTAVPLRQTRIAVARAAELAPNVVQFVPAMKSRVSVRRSANSPGLELAALLAA